MLSESSFIELSIFRFGVRVFYCRVRVFYCRVRVSQTRVRARVRVFFSGPSPSPVRVSKYAMQLNSLLDLNYCDCVACSVNGIAGIMKCLY